jgi:hypothetical protein
MTGLSGKNGIMKSGSNHAWWLAAMMYGGRGMFSSPVTVARKRWVMIHLAIATIQR